MGGLNGKAILREMVSELLQKELPMPVRYSDWIFEGVNLIAGRPKLGKTTLARQKMAAAAEGLPLWGSPMPRPIPCTYLSLEEGPRLAKRKFEMAGFSKAATDNIAIFFEWPRGIAGVKKLADYLDENPGPHYIVIDSLAKFRAIPDAKMQSFMADYEAVKILHDMLKSRPGVAVDIVCHTRKMKSEDPIDEISGTYGLSAAVDTYWVMRYTGPRNATLHVGGRLWDREDHDFQMVRGNQRWDIDGKESSAQKKARDDTLLALSKVENATLSALAEELKISKQATYERVEVLISLGLVKKIDGIISLIHH